MAKRNRTTSTPRRATAARAAPEIICRLEDQAEKEAYGIGHIADLMELLGDHVSIRGNRLSTETRPAQGNIQ